MTGVRFFGVSFEINVPPDIDLIPGSGGAGSILLQDLGGGEATFTGTPSAGGSGDVSMAAGASAGVDFDVVVLVQGPIANLFGGTTLVADNLKIRNNQALGGVGNGNGILAGDGTGGGMANMLGAIATFGGCIFSNNKAIGRSVGTNGADGLGGAISNLLGGGLVLTDSILNGNWAIGGNGNSGGDGGSTSGLIHKPSDTTSQAKAGGALKHYAAADIAHFDALASNSASTVNFGSVFAYNRLLKFKSGKYPDVADGTSEGEMAESWEVSPDKLTVTMKLRQGVKFPGSLGVPTRLHAQADERLLVGQRIGWLLLGKLAAHDLQRRCRRQFRR